ncbi:uridine diphosphate-N-acetylglucosamine-binding protein YvcK [uncultured Ferrimonas sp.]|uniref:gluconeogenesis factor YvcK family protein n=1 Tax=uncultured Ferrimonas sp. TaxID=432640 RepID=UPI002627A8C0|nr:uridine diphosphate-N-acetylglucosamine-binding protein YvcK [uncultured Ferrimonas sp.]
MLANREVKVVAIGGGHGLSRLLQALKLCQFDFGAVIATTDDGGSTGRLRQRHGGIALGDIRHCISALTDDEHLGKLLLDYRFEQDDELHGHNLGNLMLLALDQLCVSPSDAIDLLRRLLAVSQPLLPMSDSSTQLRANYHGGLTIVGETAIDAAHHLPSQLGLEPSVSAATEAMQLVAAADAILVGPGSLLTSLCPTFLVTELQALLAQKPIGFICNLSSESGPIGLRSNREQIELFEHYAQVNVTCALSHGEQPAAVGADAQAGLHLQAPLIGLEAKQHCPKLLAQALPLLVAKLTAHR